MILVLSINILSETYIYSVIFFRCRKNCFSNISEEDRLTIFNHFYNSYSSKDAQDIFLQSLIDVEDVRRRRPGGIEVKKGREKSFRYNLMVGSQRREVWLSAFLAVLSVTKKRIRRLRTLKMEGKSPVDKRGKHTSFSLPPDTKFKVHEHVESFPVKESHYCGMQVQYLHADLNVKTMYEMFRKKYPDTKIGYSFYFKYFKDNFNLRFGQPQVDCCCTCEELKLKLKSPHLNDAAKRTAAADLAVHVRRSKKNLYSSAK